MIDATMTAEGDFSISESGDLAVTGISPAADEEIAACIGQLAYFGLKTDLTDFTIHPEIGSEAKKMLGLPNKPQTAELGKEIISKAIRSMGINNRLEIDSWPEDINTIAYEVKIYLGTSNRALTLVLRNALR
jgi:hypothetical protein